MKLIAKPDTADSATVVRASRSGRSGSVRGAGALRGRLAIEEGVDLT